MELHLNDIAKLKLLSKNEDHISDIDENDISKALDIYAKKIKSKKSFIKILASINLLNTVLKRKDLIEYRIKYSLHYAKVKRPVIRIVHYLINPKNNSFDAELFINKQEQVVYIEFPEWQFSFHNIKITEIMEEYLEQNPDKIGKWKEIRLQKIAGELFKFV
jgi:hypothetical protein